MNAETMALTMTAEELQQVERELTAQCDAALAAKDTAAYRHAYGQRLHVYTAIRFQGNQRYMRQLKARRSERYA